MVLIRNENNPAVIKNEEINLNSATNQDLARAQMLEKVGDVAKEVIYYGGYLTWAPYIPGSPDCLSSRPMQFLGKTCNIVHAGLQLKPNIEKMLDPTASTLERARGAIEVVRGGSVLANRMIDAAQTILPKSAEKTLDSGRDCVNKLQRYAAFSGYALNTVQFAKRFS